LHFRHEAYTASALAFLLADLPKPVVLTGAQIPLCEYSSDATNNFRGALLSAGMKDLPGTSGGSPSPSL
jgi:L-asparaginase/Glu-tRNA(Gln) amidotransferase subunit D